MMKLTEIKENPRNPRVIPDTAVSKVALSIKEYGWAVPIVVEKGTNIILAGHVRKKAAELLKLVEVPVIAVDIHDKKALAFMIMDNKSQDETDWEYGTLKEVLEDLVKEDDFDLSTTGFSAEDLNAFIMWLGAGDVGSDYSESLKEFENNPPPGLKKNFVISFSFPHDEREFVEEVLKYFDRDMQHFTTFQLDGMKTFKLLWDLMRQNTEVE